MPERADRLIEAVVKLLREDYEEWTGEKFGHDDVMRVSDYCRNEVDIEKIPYPFSERDIRIVAMAFEMRYG
jgi:hypothetical protein